MIFIFLTLEDFPNYLLSLLVFIILIFKNLLKYRKIKKKLNYRHFRKHLQKHINFTIKINKDKKTDKKLEVID